MEWALNQSDPENWLALDSQQEQLSLIEENDNEFKAWLDKYKYWDRFPEQSQQDYRIKAENFLSKLESRLQQNTYLLAIKFAWLILLSFHLLDSLHLLISLGLINPITPQFSAG